MIAIYGVLLAAVIALLILFLQCKKAGNSADCDKKIIKELEMQQIECDNQIRGIREENALVLSEAIADEEEKTIIKTYLTALCPAMDPNSEKAKPLLKCLEDNINPLNFQIPELYKSPMGSTERSYQSIEPIRDSCKKQFPCV